MQTLVLKEAQLVENYLFIEDRHERLNAIMTHSAAGCHLPDQERDADLLVKGCSSQVWLEVKLVNEKLKIRFAADSAMVKGLVALLVDLYQGAAASEVETFKPTLFDQLELTRMLSQTRLNGLAQVESAFLRAANI